MPSPTERQQINRFLGRAGLAQMGEPAILLQQMGTMIQDHDHFRRMLAKCDPEQRYSMYESLRPHLRFTPKTLGDYMIESARMAEQRQYPTVDAEGNLHAFRTAEVESDEYIAERAIYEATAKEKLWLVCKKCTREDVFMGQRKSDAIAEARAAGWTYDESKGSGRETCPACMAAVPGKAPEITDAQVLLNWMRLNPKFTPAQAAEETGIKPARVLELLAGMTKRD